MNKKGFKDILKGPLKVVKGPPPRPPPTVRTIIARTPMSPELRRDVTAILDERPAPSFVLTEDEQYAVFAALCTMIDDVHAVQDQMTAAQWDAAEALYKRLTKIVDAREAK